MPTTSHIPCCPTDQNWKMAWIYGDHPWDNDSVLPVRLLGVQALTCNDCYNYWEGRVHSTGIHFDFSEWAYGSWFRYSFWIKATYDYKGEKQMWLMSTDENMPITEKIYFPNSRQWKMPGDHYKVFSIASWARLSTWSESYGFYDDVYFAIGPHARARVEVGNADTYNNCTNLSICTVTSWKDNSITATLRQGAFNSFDNTFLYVTDADGIVNTNGYPLRIDGTSPPDDSITIPSPPSGFSFKIDQGTSH